MIGIFLYSYTQLLTKNLFTSFNLLLYFIHMKIQQFNYKEIFSFGWSKTRQHAWFLACTAMIYMLIMSAAKFTPGFDILVAILLSLSLLSLSLTIAKNESFTFSDLFNRLRSPHLVLKFLALTVVYIAAVSVLVMPFIAAMTISAGAMFMGQVVATGKLIALTTVTFILFVAGIYVSVCYKFYPYVLLENEHMSLVNIIKHTQKITCCNFWPLFAFLVMVSLLNIVGILLFGFGLIITLPISVFAFAHVYRKLEVHSH